MVHLQAVPCVAIYQFTYLKHPPDSVFFEGSHATLFTVISEHLVPWPPLSHGFTINFAAL